MSDHPLPDGNVRRRVPGGPTGPGPAAAAADVAPGSRRDRRNGARRAGLATARSSERARELRQIADHLRRVVVDDLATEVRRRSAGSLDPLNQMNRRRRAEATVNRELLENYRVAAGAPGQRQLSQQEEAEVQALVLSLVFSRRPELERLLERGDVTNIFHNGPHDARVRLVDGTEHRIEPLFTSDDDMVTFVQSAARSGGRLETGDDLFAATEVTGGALEQEFSETKPAVDLRLWPSGARLTALGPWVTTNGTHISIRLHPLIDVDQSVLVNNWGMYDLGLASFLAAAIRLGWGILIAGRPDAGKTTLLRALAHELPPSTRLVQIEQNPELGLERMPERHDQVLGWVERSPNMEGRGAFTLANLAVEAQRHALDRVFVGEIRGPEVMAVLEAITLGIPALSTIHANTANNVLSRMVMYAQKGDSNINAAHVLRTAAEGLDLIVHLAEARDGRRAIREVLHVGDFDEVTQRPITDQWFIPDHDGFAVRNHRSPIPAEALAALRYAGYDEALHPRPGGDW